MSTTTVPMQGDKPDYEVRLNGNSLTPQDSGAMGQDDGYVVGSGELDGEPVHVFVGWGQEQGATVEIEWRNRDLVLKLEAVEDENLTGARFEGGALGVEATVTVSPNDSVCESEGDDAR